jgi:hypothetical protein
MNTETLEREAEIEALHEKVREMARQQGVRPFNSERIPRDLWPEDESVEDFLELIQEIRKSDQSGRDLE